jgi:hypothetical protein
MSRTVIRPGISQNELHGVVYYSELVGENRTYEFIERVEANFNSNCVANIDNPAYNGIDEVHQIAAHFDIHDINFVKPGIGEATRVLLRRLPDIILVAETADERYVSHLIQLSMEKSVPVIHYPLKCYTACGIIKSIASYV